VGSQAELEGEPYIDILECRKMTQRRQVRAAKDPKVQERLPARADASWTQALTKFSPNEAEALVAVVRTLCPHDWLSEIPYRTVVLILDQSAAADNGVLDLLKHALASLDKVFAIPFRNLSAGNRVICLRSCEKEPFFAYLLQKSLRAFYDDPIVWAGCGYEGVFGTSETQMRVGYNDLTWLPEPMGDRD
jgi:hypothetical protein